MDQIWRHNPLPRCTFVLPTCLFSISSFSVFNSAISFYHLVIDLTHLKNLAFGISKHLRAPLRRKTMPWRGPHYFTITRFSVPPSVLLLQRGWTQGGGGGIHGYFPKIEFHFISAVSCYNIFLAWDTLTIITVSRM